MCCFPFFRPGNLGLASLWTLPQSAQLVRRSEGSGVYVSLLPKPIRWAYRVISLVTVTLIFLTVLNRFWEASKIEDCLDMYLDPLSNISIKAAKKKKSLETRELCKTSKWHTYSHSCSAEAPACPLKTPETLRGGAGGVYSPVAHLLPFSTGGKQKPVSGAVCSRVRDAVTGKMAHYGSGSEQTRLSFGSEFLRPPEFPLALWAQCHGDIRHNLFDAFLSWK